MIKTKNFSNISKNAMLTPMKSLIKFLNWCLDLIFPKYCLGCGLEGSYVCQTCFDSLLMCLSAHCFICGRRSPSGFACDTCRHKKRSALAGILVAADWKNLLLRQIIYEYKYRFVKELVDPLSRLMINFLEHSEPESWRIDQSINYPTDKLVLIPVPLHGRRFAWRGFNQAELLAQKISPRFNVPPAKNILIRSRHTLPQQTIANQKTRTENIKNAFAIFPKLKTENNFLKDKIVILIDDICTTGATLEDCARALKPLGPKEIWGLVIARG